MNKKNISLEYLLNNNKKRALFFSKKRFIVFNSILALQDFASQEFPLQNFFLLL